MDQYTDFAHTGPGTLAGRYDAIADNSSRMSTEEEPRQQNIEARQRQMSESLERLWQVNLGERPPAGGLRLEPPADDER